jgi:hypothetical protein
VNEGSDSMVRYIVVVITHEAKPSQDTPGQSDPGLSTQLGSGLIIYLAGVVEWGYK